MLPRKVALPTSSHVMPIEAWRSAVSTTSEGRRVSSEVRLENCTQVWGLGQIWTVWNSRLRKNSASHVYLYLSQPVRHTVTMHTRRAMSFFHFRMFLFFGLTSYPAKIGYFNSPNGELSYGVRVLALYWSKIVDPSRSPCLRTVQRKSLERGNFLVLRPVLLKNAHFNAANR